MAWKDLNVRDRAQFIRQMVSLGITKSEEQADFYNNSISNFTMTKQVPIKPLTAKAEGGHLFGGEPIDTVNGLSALYNSKAEFANRLNTGDTTTIKAWNDHSARASYKMGSADNIVFPNVQKINGQLVDFTRPPYSIYAGYNNARKTGNYVTMPNEATAIYFGEHYKKYYPEIFGK